jgi:hypothetical protein
VNENERRSVGGVLVVGVLTVESTRADGSERAAEGTTDSVQFWITPTHWWKFRTLAVDHDLLAWDLGDLRAGPDDRVGFAQQHIEKHYGDILASIAIVSLPAPHDAKSAEDALRGQHLAGELQRLEVAEQETWLWRPDGDDYWTRE